METITMEQDAMAQAKDLKDNSSLSNDDLKKLHEMSPTYPGWGMDFENAFDSYEAGDGGRFKASCRELKEKQRVFDGVKLLHRMGALAALVLTYPGGEQDFQNAAECHMIKNVSNEENDRMFQDKLEGMKNKERVYVGDRTHPDIVAIDKLELTYPGWEVDYQFAFSAHCEAPSARFPAAFHALRERQQVFSGDRSHWRLVQLDKMTLSYPGWEEDIKEVEDWHLVNDMNNGMFFEVLEGMKDQQMIYMGWDHDSTDSPSTGRFFTDLDKKLTTLSEPESESVLSYSSKSTGSDQGSFSTFEKEADSVEIKAPPTACYQGCYMSITESLKTHAQKKKQLVEERTQSRPKPGPEARTPSRPPTTTTTTTTRVLANKGWFAPRPAAGALLCHGQSNDSEGTSDKRVNLGKCVVCLNRKKTHVFMPCGHLCACAPCGSRAMKMMAGCPICRGKADQTFRVFLA
jgi:hypothetical protein